MDCMALTGQFVALSMSLYHQIRKTIWLFIESLKVRGLILRIVVDVMNLLTGQHGKCSPINLDKSVELRKNAQVLDSSSYMKKVLIINKVTENCSCIFCINAIRGENHAFFHYASQTNNSPKAPTLGAHLFHT